MKFSDFITEGESAQSELLQAQKALVKEIKQDLKNFEGKGYSESENKAKALLDAVQRTKKYLGTPKQRQCAGIIKGIVDWDKIPNVKKYVEMMEA